MGRLTTPPGPAETERHRRWRAASRAAAVAVAGTAAAMLWSDTAAAGRVAGSGWSSWVAAGLLEIVTLALDGGVAWLAWRLWARWSAGTVRLVAGTLVVLVTCLASIKADAVLRRAGLNDAADVASCGLLLAGLTGGAVAYRWATRAVMRSAELDDPAGPDGRPTGHAGRVRLFCQAVGWQTFVTLSAVARWAGWSGVGTRSEWRMGVAMAGPLAIAWATYRLLRWRLLPPPPPMALPAGGFPVVMGSLVTSQ